MEPATWEEALRIGSRNVRLTERLLAHGWLLPFPLPVEDPQGDGGEQERTDGEYTEVIVLGLYWGSAPPSQPPHSVLLALPEIAAAGVDGVTTAAVPCLDAAGQHVGDATCAVLIASAEYVGKHLCESSPVDASVVAFMEELPGCQPTPSSLFVDEHIPSPAEAGTWLYVDEQGAVRVRTQGVIAEETYLSAPEGEATEGGDLLQVQPWLGESAALAPARRGRQRRPSILGLGSSAKQLASALYRPQPKKAAAPGVKALGVKSKATASGQAAVDPMLLQILSAVTEIGTRVSALEHQQHQQPQLAACAAAPPAGPPPPPKAPSETLQCKGSPCAPPPFAAASAVAAAPPWSPRPPAPGACAAGFLPCGAAGGQSILSAGSAQGSYQQALAEAQRLLGTAQPVPPPAATSPVVARHIPSGLPTGHGGSAKVPDRERRVDADLKAAIMKGGDDSQVAVNLAILDALSRVGNSSGARSSHDLDPFDQFFEQDGHHHDTDSSKGGSASGVRSLARLAAAIQREPDRWTQQCNMAAARALGADVQGVHWTMEEYGARQLRFRGNESLERMWALLSHLHGLMMRGEVALALARVCQFLKATELATQCNGHWRLAWSLTALPEIRSMAANSVGHGLGHPLEYHASVQWLRDCNTIETAIKKGDQPEGQPQQHQQHQQQQHPSPKPPGGKQPGKSGQKKGQSSEGNS
eukprot:2937560-Amphidinium_carterae.2